MKLSVIGPTYPYKGGISHFTTTLVKHLREKNSVDFISWSRQYPAFLYPVELKDTKSKVQIKEKALYLLDFFNPITWIQAALHVKRSASDILILTWVSPVQAPIYFIIGYLTKLLTPTKILYICHNVLPHESTILDKILIKLAFSQGDEFVVHSEEDKKILHSIIKNKLVIKAFHPIYDIFNLGLKYNISKLKKEIGLNNKVLLFFGYIRPYKGLIYLIRALPKILKSLPDLSLLIVGEFWSKDKPQYIDVIKKLKVGKNIVLIEKYVPNEDVGKYFSIADIVVLPYVTATQSGIVQLAYAFNKPVITTAVGGLKDVLEDGKTGYFIKIKNSNSIVVKVIKFYRSKISPHDIEKLKKELSWGKYIKIIHCNEKDS